MSLGAAFDKIFVISFNRREFGVKETYRYETYMRC